MSYLRQKWKKPDFVSEIQHVETYPDFEKLALVIQRDLQGFMVKNFLKLKMGRSFQWTHLSLLYEKSPLPTLANTPLPPFLANTTADMVD